MNRQTKLTSTQVFNLKVGDRPWIHDRFEVVPRHIGKVVKVTNAQVHIEMDYGINGGSRDIVYKFHRLDGAPNSWRLRAGNQMDSTKEKTIYGLATPAEVKSYKAAIDEKVREREQKQIVEEARTAHENKINMDLPANFNVTKQGNGKWSANLVDLSLAQVRAIQEAL